MQQHESDPSESLPPITLRQEKYLAEDLNPSEATASYSSPNLTFSQLMAFFILLQVRKRRGRSVGDLFI